MAGPIGLTDVTLSCGIGTYSDPTLSMPKAVTGD